MRLNLASDLKTRTGAPETKDARLKNCYVEIKGNDPAQAGVRKRPIAQGGVQVGSGIAQGGCGLVVVYGDTLYPIPIGTTCNGATLYQVGDKVTVNFVDYWATTAHVGNCPTGLGNADWSTSFVPSVPSVITAYAKFDVNSPARLIVSGGNLVITIPLTAVLGGCLSAYSTIYNYHKSSGKWYWEVTLTQLISTNDYVDIGIYGPGDINFTRWLGRTAGGYSYGMLTQTAAASKSNNNVLVNYGATLVQGDVIGVALDMDLGNLTFYKNGVSQGIAYSGLVGSQFGAAIGGIAQDGDIILTANFGASPFAFSVPAGYNAGLYL